MIFRLKTVFKNAPALKSQKGKAEESEDTSLTIIIPTYNEERNIENCLLALLDNVEPCRRWNIIVSDDCSSDNTIKVINKIQNEHFYLKKF